MKGVMLMNGLKMGHIEKLPVGSINENVIAEPSVKWSADELKGVLEDLKQAVQLHNYVSPTPTPNNPALSDDYIFDTEDQDLILENLNQQNFVGKIKDLSKGALKRRALGFPEEYLYVFRFDSKLTRRDSKENSDTSENVLIYIKINDRKIPYNKIFVVSFHKNNTR